MNTLLILLFAGCLALSFFLSGMESGVFALSRLRIRHLMRSGNSRAAALHGYLENPENFLWTILVGNTLANLGSVSIGVLWLYRSLFPWPWLLLPLLGLSVLVFYAVVELLPKMMFRLYPNRLCLALALPFRLVHVLLGPLVAPVTLLAHWLLRWSGGRRFTGHLFGTREELRQVMHESAKALSSDERTMINRVLDLQNLTIRQVTIPLSAAVTVAASCPLKEVFAQARAHGFNRLPVRREDEGGRWRIAGVLDLRSLLYQPHLDENRCAGEFVQTALYLDDQTRFEVALRRMQRTGQRLALVLAPDGREVGIVALQDILRAIFGEVKL
jgi:CBS domain containing-hemolysin-like protein